MQQTYHITVKSMMGDRNGTLQLIFHDDDQVEGILSLLGYDNFLKGKRAGLNQVQMDHSLRTALQEYPCQSYFYLTEDHQLSGLIHTEQETLCCYGTQISVEKQIL